MASDALQASFLVLTVKVNSPHLLLPLLKPWGVQKPPSVLS